jgi:hypothetical protein
MMRAAGFAQAGSREVWTSGHASSTLHQESFPYALITVYKAGTTALQTIYLDNYAQPTPLANPFTADVMGFWFFYAPNGRYDISLVFEDQLDWTIGDVLLFDPEDA